MKKVLSLLLTYLTSIFNNISFTKGYTVTKGKYNEIAQNAGLINSENCVTIVT